MSANEGCRSGVKDGQKHVKAMVFLVLAAQVTTIQADLESNFLYATNGMNEEAEDVTEGFTESEEQAFSSTKGEGELIDDSCEVSLEGWNRLERNLQNASMEFLSRIDNDFKNDLQNLCGSLVTYVNNQASYMLQQAKLLTEVALEDKKTFEILKAEYKIELSKFAEIVYNLSKDNKTEISTIENEFGSKFLLFQKNLSYSLDQIETLIALKKKAIFELCVSQIRKGQYQSALESFKRLGNRSLLTNIVTDAYGGDIQYLPNAIKFIKISDSCDHQTLAYQALFDSIKTDDHLSHPNILYFSDLIEECVGVSLKKELEVYKAIKVKSLVYEFNLEKVFDALEFEKKFPTEEVAIRFSIYSILFDELDKNNHLNSRELIALGYRIKSLDQFCGTNSSDCKYLTPKLSALKTKFPNGLRALLFDRYVFIESMVHEGYALYSKDDGDVFTVPRSDGPNERWLFRPVNDSRYIELESMQSGGKLFVSDDKVLVGSYHDLAGHWELIPEENGNYYNLKSRENGKGLDANGLESCSGTSTGYCSLPYTHEYSEVNPHQQWKFS